MTFLLISAPGLIKIKKCKQRIFKVAIFGWAYALWSLLAFASFLVNGREYFPEISTIFPYSIDDESTSDGDFYSRILKNSLLFGFWGFHHSFMCRRSVKKLMNLPKVVFLSQLWVKFLGFGNTILCYSIFWFISLRDGKLAVHS